MKPLPTAAAPRAGGRWRWPLLSAAAALLLLALAVYSPDRQQRLVSEAAGGSLRHLALADLREARIRRPNTADRTFTRRDGAWTLDGQTVPTPVSQALDTALRLLHNTPPTRRFEQASPDFQLDVPTLEVSVLDTAGQRYTLAVGAANPMGLERYVRIAGGPDAGLALLAGDVAQAWQALAEQPIP